jgi:Aspartyl protease./Ubiquitin interaction motif.
MNKFFNNYKIDIKSFDNSTDKIKNILSSYQNHIAKNNNISKPQNSKKLLSSKNNDNKNINNDEKIAELLMSLDNNDSTDDELIEGLLMSFESNKDQKSNNNRELTKTKNKDGDHDTDNKELSKTILMSLENTNEHNIENDDNMEIDDGELSKAIAMSLENNDDNDDQVDDEELAKAIMMSQENKNGLFISELWKLAHEDIGPLIHSRCKAVVKVNIGDNEIECLIDTGAQMNVITTNLIDKLKLQSYVDSRYKGDVLGVGQAKIVGIIPYIEIKVKDINIPLDFTVIESTFGGNSQCIIGLPSIIHYQMELDFGKSKIKIKNIEIPMQLKENK